MFAFVRFKNVYNAQILESQMSNTWIGSHRLHVNRARFQEAVVDHPQMESKAMKKKVQDGSRNGKKTYIESVERWIRKDELQKQVDRTKSVPQKAKEDFKEGRKAVQLEAEEDDLTWLQGCLIREVKEIETASHIIKIFAEEGLGDFPIKYAGGLGFLVEVRSHEKASMLLKQKMNLFL